MSRFLIVGTGRSGTRFMSHLMRSAGINCGHESVYTLKFATQNAPSRDRRPSWGNYEADSSWLAVPYLDRLDIPSIQVVRHPLATVQSMLELGWFSGQRRNVIPQIIFSSRPEIRYEKTRPDKCLAFWIYWNQTAQMYARRWFSLEHFNYWDMKMLLGEVGQPADRKVDWNVMEKLADDPVATNKKPKDEREPWDITWDSFRPRLKKIARRMAVDFGCPATWRDQ
jgi:hypothetical protein